MKRFSIDLPEETSYTLIMTKENFIHEVTTTERTIFCVECFNIETREWVLDKPVYPTLKDAQSRLSDILKNKVWFTFSKARIVKRFEQIFVTTLEEADLPVYENTSKISS